MEDGCVFFFFTYLGFCCIAYVAPSYEYIYGIYIHQVHTFQNLNGLKLIFDDYVRYCIVEDKERIIFQFK